MKISIKAYIIETEEWVELNPFVMENCNIADCYMLINGQCCFVQYSSHGTFIEIKKRYSDQEAKIVYEVLPAKYEWDGYELPLNKEK